MQQTDTVTPEDEHDCAQMFTLYQKRGPQTESDLLSAGISKDSQQRNAAAVAYRIRLFGTAQPRSLSIHPADLIETQSDSGSAA